MRSVNRSPAVSKNYGTMFKTLFMRGNTWNLQILLKHDQFYYGVHLPSPSSWAR